MKLNYLTPSWISCVPYNGFHPLKIKQYIFFYMEREGINLDSDSNRNAKNCFYLEFADIQIWLVHDSSNIDLHLKFFTKFNINS